MQSSKTFRSAHVRVINCNTKSPLLSGHYPRMYNKLYSHPISYGDLSRTKNYVGDGYVRFNYVLAAVNTLSVRPDFLGIARDAII